MANQKEQAFHPTNAMYTTLFNGITDAKKKLSDLTEFFDSLQEKTEQIYIEQDDIE